MEERFHSNGVAAEPILVKTNVNCEEKAIGSSIEQNDMMDKGDEISRATLDTASENGSLESNHTVVESNINSGGGLMVNGASVQSGIDITTNHTHTDGYDFNFSSAIEAEAGCDDIGSVRRIVSGGNITDSLGSPSSHVSSSRIQADVDRRYENKPLDLYGNNNPHSPVISNPHPDINHADDSLVDKDYNLLRATSRPDTLGALNFATNQNQATTSNLPATGPVDYYQQSTSDTFDNGMSVTDGVESLAKRYQPPLRHRTRERTNRPLLNERTRAAGMDEAELQMMNSEDESSNEVMRYEGVRHDGVMHEGARDEGVRHEGLSLEGVRHEGARNEEDSNDEFDENEELEDYRGVRDQCESTEADQYKMNPEADQSSAGAEWNQLGEDNNPTDYRVANRSNETSSVLSSSSDGDREGDGSQGLAEDDQQFVGREMSRNAEADGSEEEDHISRVVRGVGHSAGMMSSVISSTSGRHSPADGSGTSSLGAAMRATNVTSNQSSRVKALANNNRVPTTDHMSGVVGGMSSGAVNLAERYPEQRIAVASGSDDEAFLSKQRISKSPLKHHPHSAFTKPRGVGRTHDESGHGGGVGQESNGMESSLQGLAVRDRTRNSEAAFSFVPIANGGESKRLHNIDQRTERDTGGAENFGRVKTVGQNKKSSHVPISTINANMQQIGLLRTDQRVNRNPVLLKREVDSSIDESVESSPQYFSPSTQFPTLHAFSDPGSLVSIVGHMNTQWNMNDGISDRLITSDMGSSCFDDPVGNLNNHSHMFENNLHKFENTRAGNIIHPPTTFQAVNFSQQKMNNKSEGFDYNGKSMFSKDVKSSNGFTTFPSASSHGQKSDQNMEQHTPPQHHRPPYPLLDNSLEMSPIYAPSSLMSPSNCRFIQSSLSVSDPSTNQHTSNPSTNQHMSSLSTNQRTSGPQVYRTATNYDSDDQLRGNGSHDTHGGHIRGSSGYDSNNSQHLLGSKQILRGVTSIQMNENSLGSIKQASRDSNQTSREVSDLQELRSRLQSLLTLTDRSMPNKSSYDQTSDMNELLLPRSAESVLTSRHQVLGSILDQSSTSDLSSLTGLRDALPLSSRYVVGGVSQARPDVSSLLAENQSLTESLEREQFKRKHCEKQIQQLQNTVLELQQNLAVSVSTDRKKDIMLEQFDKALMKIVDGWNEKDSDRRQVISRLNDENISLRRALDMQNQIVSRIEHQLKVMSEHVEQEHTRMEQVCMEKDGRIETLLSDCADMRATLESERQQWRRRVDSEREHASEEIVRNQAEISRVVKQLQEEQKVWSNKEAEYLSNADEQSKNYQYTLEIERKKQEKLNSKLGELQVLLRASQNEVKQLKTELNTVNREKESLKVEMGLAEARLESSKRMLESDLIADSQRVLSEKLAELREHQMAAERRQIERQREEIVEVTERHREEVRQLNAEHQSSVQWLNDKHLQREREWSDRVKNLEEVIENLQETNRTIQLNKSDLAEQLQTLMQSHCNEAMRLLQQNKPSTVSTNSPSSTANSPARSVSSRVSESDQCSVNIDTVQLAPSRLSLYQQQQESQSLDSKLSSCTSQSRCVAERPADSFTAQYSQFITSVHNFQPMVADLKSSIAAITNNISSVDNVFSRAIGADSGLVRANEADSSFSRAREPDGRGHVPAPSMLCESGRKHDDRLECVGVDTSNDPVRGDQHLPSSALRASAVNSYNQRPLSVSPELTRDDDWYECESDRHMNNRGRSVQSTDSERESEETLNKRSLFDEILHHEISANLESREYDNDEQSDTLNLQSQCNDAGVSKSSSVIDQELRSKHLQQYIRRLLQKSPGVSQKSKSHSAVHSDASGADNREVTSVSAADSGASNDQLRCEREDTHSSYRPSAASQQQHRVDEQKVVQLLKQLGAEELGALAESEFSAEQPPHKLLELLQGLKNSGADKSRSTKQGDRRQQSHQLSKPVKQSSLPTVTQGNKASKQKEFRAIAEPSATRVRTEGGIDTRTVKLSQRASSVGSKRNKSTDCKTNTSQKQSSNKSTAIWK